MGRPTSWPDQLASDEREPALFPLRALGRQPAAPARRGLVVEPLAGKAERGPAPAAAGVLARLATDILPEAGALLDLVLDRWTDSLNLADPGVRRAAVHALGWLACTRLDDEPRATRRWANEGPNPPIPDRVAVHAVSRTPAGLWRIEAMGEGWVEVSDRIGLGEGHIPTGAVRCEAIGAVGAPPQVGDTLAARMVCDAEGWTACLPLSVPGGPRDDQIAAWVTEGLGWLESWGEAPDLRALLRSHGAWLVRRLHRDAWVRSTGGSRLGAR